MKQLGKKEHLKQSDEQIYKFIYYNETYIDT